VKTRLSNHARDPWAFGAALLIALATMVMLYTFLDYGLTYDEHDQHTYATHVWRWYLTGGRESAALNYKNLMYYGAFFEMLAELGARWSPWGTYEGRHFVNVLFALSGIIGTYCLGRLVDSPRAGFLAALFLLATPEFYGHSFNNPKDIPVAVLSVWALFAILKGTRERCVRWPRVLAAGISLGLLLAVRAGMVFYVGYLGLAWIGALTLWHWTAGTESRELIRDAARLAGQLCFAVGVAWIIMLAFWPYGQVGPIEHPIRAIAAAARFPWNNPVRFQGMDIPAMELPRTYLPVQIAIRLPEFLLLALACGVGVLVAGRTWRRLARCDFRIIDLSILILTLAVLFPIGSAIVLRSTLYDGMRHFIFTLPPLAVLAAAGVSRLLDLPLTRRVRVAVVAAVAVGILAVLWDMIALHPYQSVYFNRLVAGGLRGAAPRFETDYWGASYREAADWVFRNYRSAARAPTTVRNCSADFLTRYVIDRNPSVKARFTIAPPNTTPNLLLATERWHCHEVNGGRLLHIVQRQGVPLAYVYELRSPVRAGVNALIN
jgi:4-amino-4-deoxy-L-arabinose transferase-like glycosyltransferase